MLRPISVVLYTMTLTTGGWVYAGEKVDLTIDAQMSGSLYIDNTRGQLIIEGWDKPHIQLQGELDDATKKLVFKSRGHKAIMKVVLKDGRHRGHGSELKIYIPNQTQLRFKGVNTNYQVAGLKGVIEGKTINGHLSLKDNHAKMNISSVTGRVKVYQSSGMARVESVSGAVDFSGAFQLVKLKSMTGNIVANINDIGALKVENVSGDIAIKGQLKDKADVRLSSVSGDIHYKASGTFNAECEIASQFGGNIKNTLTKDKPWSELLQQRKLEFVSGDGSGKLVMHTVSGSVTLEK